MNYLFEFWLKLRILVILLILGHVFESFYFVEAHYYFGFSRKSRILSENCANCAEKNVIHSLAAQLADTV